MTLNSISMIHQNLETDFDLLLAMVVDERAANCAADQMERHLFKQILRLGANLLQMFFDMRSQMYPRQEVDNLEGVTLPYHSEKSRAYYSIFGELVITRPYFYTKEAGGCSPLDAELGLGQDSYSDFLRELHEELGVYKPFAEGIRFVERLLDIRLSQRCLPQFMATDGADVADFYEQKPPPPVATEAAILVVQADGKGVPIIKASRSQEKVRLTRGEARSRKKAVTVTTAYTIHPAVRSVESVLVSLLQVGEENPPSPRSGPQHKQLWGTLRGKSAALDHLQREVAKRQGDHIQHRVMLCDGDPSLQAHLQERFPEFTLILDFIHAYEYLWQVASTLYGQDSPERLPWVVTQTRALLKGEAAALSSYFRQLAQEKKVSSSQQTILHKVANYYENNQAFMAYATYLAQGWPIASGVIEGACRHFVKDRMELSGMRWSVNGAENVLHLRAVAENNDWQAYHRFRQQQRQQRLYQRDWPEPVDLPTLARPLERLRSVSGRELNTPTATTKSSYTRLPLAV